MGFFQFEIIINVLFGSFRFIWIAYLCYGFMAIRYIILSLSVQGLSLYVSIWRLKTVHTLKSLKP